MASRVASLASFRNGMNMKCPFLILYKHINSALRDPLHPACMCNDCGHTHPTTTRDRAELARSAHPRAGSGAPVANHLRDGGGRAVAPAVLNSLSVDARHALPVAFCVECLI